MAKLKAIRSWNGGGLSADQDPGANTAGSCGLVMQVKGQGFVQSLPRGG